MQKFYRIHPSRPLYGLKLAINALMALACTAYVGPPLLQYCGMAFFLLLGWRECEHWNRRQCINLGFDPFRRTVTLTCGGQPYFQGKYKVYANRWFAILRLIDKRKNRTLILHCLRFDTDRSYRQLRFALAEQERNNAA